MSGPGRRSILAGMGAALTFTLAGHAVSAPGTGSMSGTASIDRLSWLAGCWESPRGERQTEEHWMPPRGGTMLGMSRTVIAGRMSEFEYMRIGEQEGRLVFTARPSGQEEASFRASRIEASAVVFENLAHDFPQRVMYRRQADGSLLARIEGERDGKARGVDFPMRRVPCDGPPPKGGQ